MRQLNLQGLTDDQVELVERFVEYLRESKERMLTVEELKRFLEKCDPGSPPLPDAEVSRLAEKAVEYARGK